MARRFARCSVVVVLLAFAGCAYSKAASEPKGPAGAATMDADQAQAELDRAEREVASALGTAPMAPPGQSPPPMRAEEDKGSAADAAPSKKAEPSSGAEPLSADGGRCVTACRALGSMRRASEHLCGLTGETDTRCDDAKNRLRAAEGKVHATCPACASE